MVNASDLPELAAIFKAAIAAHLAPLQAEVAVLKARLDDRPVAKDGAPGRDGKDAPPIDFEDIAARAAKYVRVPVDGKDGEPGKDGHDGINGAAGKDGINGKDGRDGIDGKDGASVDPLVVRAMVVDAVASVVKELPVPKDGRDGRDGKDGRDGTAGAAGRDGSAIDYVDLDAAKSYPRGTHALARGGILYAERTTDPVVDNDFKAAGWRQLTGGLAGIEVRLLSDGRTFEFCFEGTDGRREMLQAKADIPAHRGVWREAVTYEKGDVVQWSGNGWIAREVTTDKPGDSKAWDLLARRGRDGKDA